MKTNPFLIGAVALLIGLVVGYGYGTWNDTGKTTSGHDMHSTMTDMQDNLEDKNGAEFDQVFLAEMILHHEGALAMAQVALQKSARPELKDLANDIIESQTSEITLMRQWLDSWFSAESR